MLSHCKSLTRGKNVLTVLGVSIVFLVACVVPLFAVLCEDLQALSIPGTTIKSAASSSLSKSESSLRQ